MYLCKVKLDVCTTNPSFLTCAVFKNGHWRMLMICIELCMHVVIHSHFGSVPIWIWMNVGVYKWKVLLQVHIRKPNHQACAVFVNGCCSWIVDSGSLMQNCRCEESQHSCCLWAGYLDEICMHSIITNHVGIDQTFSPKHSLYVTVKGLVWHLLD